MAYKTLGKLSARLIHSLYDNNKTIFTIKDMVGITGLSEKAASDFAGKLIRRQIISRIKAGKYIIIPQELGETDTYTGDWNVIAREISNDPGYYLSYYSAMSVHNMVTHPILKIYISSPKQARRKKRIVGNASYEYIYISRNKIWGVKNTWVTKSEQVRVSDIERTVIDCLSRPELCGGVVETAAGIWIQKDQIDFAKLYDYLLKFNSYVVIKRFGYITECLGLQGREYLDKLREKINDKYYILDPMVDNKKTYSNSWKLIANISREEIADTAKT
ncbi:MAG: hypothetical protein COS89_06200 [Deltaproteobacteria bacterium CG07_land_8_20_14_0_80_38_7]|nr:MAG: hypothetical protein COS89_06200 [Deltaproteobacteria bacterium CG07_land_8_20_14_0_80_38_7]